MDKQQIMELAHILDSKTEVRRKNIVLQCPMAPVTHASGTDRNPAFSVKIDEHAPSVAHCWACGVSGTLLSVMEDANLALQGLYEHAVRFVQEHDKGGLAGDLARLQLKRRTDPREGAPFDVVTYIARCSGKVPQYLIDRGIVRADVDRWRIGYDEERKRAIFPVWDETGLLLGAARRTVLPKEVESVKYHDTPGLRKEDVFYGEHAIDSTRGKVYVVEGILDAIFASRVLPNVVALMGAHTGIGDTRLAKLRRWARSVVVILDADRAGDEAWAGRVNPKGKFVPGLRDRLREFFPTFVAHLPPGEDPASVPSATLLAAVKNAAYLAA